MLATLDASAAIMLFLSPPFTTSSVKNIAALDHDFKIFQNFAAAAENVEEFRELYKKYFTWEDLE